ncbi:hypothetical protein [Halalkalicoccus subterraneus]|uniref:hypothetical protein n=1 Tax=Halalkalicoccus subterraneus TaxID=2675002 RepID=UPI000EFAFD79|nr:hypothetical protein [Halalkalicoccus subterraneus]
MTETLQCWLVERTYDDKGLIRLTYVPTDGSGQYVTERAAATGPDATAAMEVESENLGPIDGANAERYESEAERMAERHDPDDSI